MEQFTHLIALYGYFAIFPLSIVEGPIITMLGGFFVRLGVLDPFLVYIIVVVGDAMGDGLYFAIGYFAGRKFIDWIVRIFRIKNGYEERASKHFNDHGYKTLIAAKLLQGAGPVGLIAAGSSGMPYGRYMRMCVSVSLVQSAIFLIVGILFGHAYAELSKTLNTIEAATVILSLGILLIFIIFKLKQPYSH